MSVYNKGKNLLYKYCLKNNISHSRIGKWVVSPNMAQQEEIEKVLSIITLLYHYRYLIHFLLSTFCSYSITQSHSIFL